MASKTMLSEREIWTRRKIFCRIESRIERALPVGVFVRKGQPVHLPRVAGCPVYHLPFTLHPIVNLKNRKLCEAVVCLPAASFPSVLPTSRYHTSGKPCFCPAHCTHYEAWRRSTLAVRRSQEAPGRGVIGKR